MKLFFLILLFLLISCSNPTASNQIEIDSEISMETLLVKNNSNQDIYYFICEQECLALIDWAPGFDGPAILSNQQKTISFQEVVCGENLKTGDKIVFYWWTNLQNFADIKSILITL